MIMHGHIPHGATGPATRIRPTTFPWYVGIQDDNESREVIEGGTWSELSRAHRDLMAPKATPAGLANRYGAIPYKFPAAVEVTGLGGLSDAWAVIIRWREVATVQAASAGRVLCYCQGGIIVEETLLQGAIVVMEVLFRFIHQIAPLTFTAIRRIALMYGGRWLATFPTIRAPQASRIVGCCDGFQDVPKVLSWQSQNCKLLYSVTNSRKLSLGDE